MKFPKPRSSAINAMLILATMLIVAVLSPAGLLAFRVHAEFEGYTRVALDLPGQLFGRELDRYYIGRAFPSAAAYLVTGLFQLPHTLPNTLAVYAGINVLLAGCITGLYCRLSDRLGYDLAGKLIGYVSLFTGFLFWHHVPFVPPTTDAWGMLLTFLAVDAFLAGRSWLLYVVMVVGAFTWPTLLIGCALLLLFPYDKDREPRPTVLSWRLALLLAVAAFIFWLASAGYMLRKGLPTATIFEVETLPLVPICMLVVAVYLIPGLTTLLNDERLFDVRKYLTPKLLFRLLGVGAAGIGITVVKGLFSQPGGQNLKIYWGTHVAQTPLFKPANFVLTHFLFWGPVVVILLLHWPAIARQIQRLGVGMTAYMALGVLASLHTDPRMLMGFFPIAIVLAVREVQASARGARSYLVYGVVSLLLSKIWVSLDVLPLADPAGWWWATYGTWMTNPMYFVQGAVALPLAGLLTYEFWPRTSRTTAVADEGLGNGAHVATA